MDFVDGTLCIYKLQTFDLTNTEIMGQQDPYIRVRVGEIYCEKTYTQDNGGGDVVFDFLDFKAPVTKNILETGKIQVEAWDENSKIDLRGDVLIGSGSALLENITNIGENVEIEIPIKDKKGTLSGKILVFLRLEEKLLIGNNLIPINLDFISGTVYIKRIVSFNLENTEILALFGDKQNPYVSLSIKNNDGLEWDGVTSVLNNNNSNDKSSLWDFLDFRFDVTRNQLINGILNIIVKNKNNLQNDFIIGEGCIELKNINQLNKLLELSLDLKTKDKKGNFVDKLRGRLVLYIELKLKENKEYILKEGFQFGKLQITRIQTYNLKNTEILSTKQDPYFVLKLGDHWTEKSYTQNNVTKDVLWNFLTINCDINSDQIRNNELEILIYDENNTRKDCLIGKGQSSLMICGSDIGKEKELNINILDEKGLFAGRVLIFAKIIEFEEDDNIIISNNFIDGTLKIKRITLSNTSINKQFHISKIEPYVKIKLDKFNERTTKYIDSKELNNITWNNLNYSINCDNKCIQSSELIVEVWTHSSLNLNSDILISTSKIPLRKSGGYIGKEIEITRDLIIPGKEGSNGGKVTISCQLNETEIILKEQNLGTKYIFPIIAFSLFFFSLYTIFDGIFNYVFEYFCLISVLKI